MTDRPLAKALPSIEEVCKSEAFPTAIWQLQPHQSGLLPVAVGRGGPLDISWEVHGDGSVNLIFIPGMGVFKTAFQRQTLYFGHKHGDQYSVLLIDNRGMGGSSKPLMRYSTSAMAEDLLEVLSHLSWTADRSLHVCGISMGGMVAQELAYRIPERIASLNLLSTAAAIENTTSFTENLLNRITLLLPKSLDRSIQYTADSIFPPDYLVQPDNVEIPDERTPRCRVPEGGYKMFETNYARFAAQELTKQRDPGFTKAGFFMQVIAAGWHHKSRAQLQEIGDKVGRDRILVIHGTDDGMISTPHGRKLIDYLGPGQGLVLEGLGHAVINERTQWFNKLLEQRCEIGEKLSGR